MPAPMIMAGRLVGGAIMPRMPPIARMEAVSSAGTPIIISTGAMMEPALSTEAVEEPVIIPGNITMIMMRHSIRAGSLWNFSMMTEDTASRAPEASMTFMKTMAVEMTRMVST